MCNDVTISPEASKVLDPANQLRECAQMWHAHSGMNIVDPRAELAVRTGHGGLEIRNVRPPVLLSRRLGPARALTTPPPRAQSFAGGSPVECMQECEADLMCKGFVTFDLQSVCVFKQDLPTPGGLLAAMVSA